MVSVQALGTYRRLERYDMKSLTIMFFFLFCSCGVEQNPDAFPAAPVNDEWEESRLPMVDFALEVGNLQGNGDFRYYSTSLKTSADIHTIYMQIGAFIIDTNGHDVDLLRVHFRSDYQEWISYDEILSPIYPSLEECETESSYCESFDVIYGESGLVDSNEGLVGLQNTHCRYINDDGYSYRVEAWVETLETFPPSIISGTESITIDCGVIIAESEDR